MIPAKPAVVPADIFKSGLTFLKGVLLSQGFQADSSAINRIEILQSILAAAPSSAFHKQPHDVAEFYDDAPSSAPVAWMVRYIGKDDDGGSGVCHEIFDSLSAAERWKKFLDSTIIIPLYAHPAAPEQDERLEPFVIKHYSSEEFPSLKGNGFDGLEFAAKREEAQEFIDFVNSHIAALASAPVEGERELLRECRNYLLEHKEGTYFNGGGYQLVDRLDNALSRPQESAKTPERVGENLAMMLRRMIWQVHKRSVDDDSLTILAKKAEGLLKTLGLEGSPLRSESVAQTPPMSPQDAVAPLPQGDRATTANTGEDCGVPSSAIAQSVATDTPAGLVSRLRYIAETDDAKYSGIRDTLLEAAAALSEPVLGEERIFKVLVELLRLYDWRKELGLIERQMACEAHSDEAAKQMKKDLLKYGREKKAAWIEAREAITAALIERGRS